MCLIFCVKIQPPNYTKWPSLNLLSSSGGTIYCPLECVIEVQLLFVPILMVVVVVVAVSKDFFAHISHSPKKHTSLLKGCFHSLFGNFFRNIEKKIVYYIYTYYSAIYIQLTWQRPISCSSVGGIIL